MTTLNLPGRGLVEAEFIENVNQAKKALREGSKACTSADSLGAINMWVDDNGTIRCNRHEYRVVQEEAEFGSINAAVPWIKENLKKIRK